VIPKEKRVMVIGDPYLCLIAAAAGAGYTVYRGSCDELAGVVESEEYGVYIVLREVYRVCKKVLDKLFEKDALVVIVDSPKVMKEVDPKKYYEDLVAKYIGMRISLG